MAWESTSVPLMPKASFEHFCHLLFYWVTNDFPVFICLFYPGSLGLKSLRMPPVPVKILAVKLPGQTMCIACQSLGCQITGKVMISFPADGKGIAIKDNISHWPNEGSQTSGGSSREWWGITASYSHHQRNGVWIRKQTGRLAPN